MRLWNITVLFVLCDCHDQMVASFLSFMIDKTAVKSNLMTASQANALNKSRGTVSMLTSNMWREDYSSSLVLELKLAMQHLLNINGLNYVVILVTNQMQSGAPSDLSSSRSFALKCVCSILVYRNSQNKKILPSFISKLFLLLLEQVNLRALVWAELWAFSQA